MFHEKTLHYLQTVSIMLTLIGVVMVLHVVNRPACCSYPSSLPRKTSPSPANPQLPLQDDEAIRKIMEQEHKDQESLRDRLLEQQRQKYLDRSKNACR